MRDHTPDYKIFKAQVKALAASIFPDMPDDEALKICEQAVARLVFSPYFILKAATKGWDEKDYEQIDAIITPMSDLNSEENQDIIKDIAVSYKKYGVGGGDQMLEEVFNSLSKLQTLEERVEYLRTPSLDPYLEKHLLANTVTVDEVKEVLANSQELLAQFEYVGSDIYIPLMEHLNVGNFYDIDPEIMQQYELALKNLASSASTQISNEPGRFADGDYTILARDPEIQKFLVKDGEGLMQIIKKVADQHMPSDNHSAYGLGNVSGAEVAYSKEALNKDNIPSGDSDHL